ncbi:MAG: M48 family metallopeptidase [Actinobacteria bacterium]|nr:M48 family metallopeptidase [Actinomycetota bacterium]
MEELKQIDVRVIRSRKRVKSVAACLNGNVLEVRAPLALPQEELDGIVEKFKRRLIRRRRTEHLNSDGALASRIDELNKRYFDGKLQVSSVKYVFNQVKSIGSCTPKTRSIRISQRAAELPQWVVDYVLIHELAHLIEANHSKRFRALVNKYPLAERARGYLMALEIEED